MTASFDAATQHLLRELAPQVLAALMRRFGDFSSCEDAVQEALLAAAVQWPEQGVPDNARGWLLRVACRRLTDQVRVEAARRRREALVVSLIPPDEQVALALDELTPERDGTLELIFSCCHPALSTSSAIALTLRAIGGLTTAEIARAFLVPEATMAQRISRAKHSIRTSSVPLGAIDPTQREARLGAVMHVLYLIFNEGYAASSGPHLQRDDLAAEALRLTRMLQRLLPEHGEVSGLLALMLLTDARRGARTGPAGELVPLDEQDRSLWDHDAIAQGVTLVTKTLQKGMVGPYQIMAAIAAVHDEAPSAGDTDWAEILGLYGLLLRISANPMVALSHAIALAMVHGPDAGLERLDALAGDPHLSQGHRLDAARGHLLERRGDPAGAVLHYRRAAERTTSLAERNYLLTRAARLDDADPAPSRLR